MHKFTQAGLERIIDRLDRAVKALKSDKQEAEKAGQEFDFDYAITLFQETHLKDYRRILAKLRRWDYSSETVEEERLRDAVEHVMSPLNQEDQLTEAAKLLARYIVNPDEQGGRKKQAHHVGLERLALIVSNSKNKNLFEAWAKEWEVSNFYDNDLGVKKQFRCVACGNQSSKNVTLLNAETGAKLSFNYQCFNMIIGDLGKLGGVISSVENAKKESSDAQSRKFNELLEKALDKMDFKEAAENIHKQDLPEEYKIVADPEIWLEQLGSMYKHFRHDIDFTTGSKEFEPHTSLRNWSRLRLEQENLPERVRDAHEKFLSLAKMTTAERLLFIQDYKLNRSVSILEAKDTLDDLFLLELRDEINLDPIRHLLKSRVALSVLEKIEEFGKNFRDKRKAHNQALLQKYGQATIDSSLKTALTYFFRDRQGWTEAYQKQQESLEANLSKKDYTILNRICERLTLGFPREMSLDYEPEEVREILLQNTPMLAAQEWLRSLTVIQRKIEYGRTKGDETSQLKDEFIPAEEFHEFTDIDKRFSLEKVLDRIEHSYSRKTAHIKFVKEKLPGLKEAAKHGLISRELTYHKDSTYEMQLTPEQAETLKQTSQEIRKLNKKIKEIKVPQQASEEKTKLLRKREELVTQRDELIIRRYLALKGDYQQYTLRKDSGQRISQNNKALSCTLQEIFENVKSYKPITEYGDLHDKIQEIADILEKTPIFVHVPNLPEDYLKPEVLRELKYVDEAGVAKLIRIHGLLTKPTESLAQAIKSANDQKNARFFLESVENAAEKEYKLLNRKGELIPVDSAQNYIKESNGIKFYAFKELSQRVLDVLCSIPLASALEEPGIAQLVETATEETYETVKKCNFFFAPAFKAFIEAARTENQEKVHVPETIIKEMSQAAEDMPFYKAQAKRQEFTAQTGTDQARTKLIDEVFAAIQSQPEKDRKAYWRLINGQKMYFSSKKNEEGRKEGWKEGPNYSRESPDEKYWRMDLVRFLDMTTTGELRGYRKRPRYGRRGEWVNYDYGYITRLAAGQATRWQYRRPIKEKLLRHAKDDSVRLTEKQAELFFIPVAEKFEKLVNNVLLEME